jgi:DNA-directed RNA polymerase specialized sigma24 family protein
MSSCVRWSPHDPDRHRPPALDALVLPALGPAFTMALLLTRDENLAQARVEEAVARLREGFDPSDSAAELRARFFRHVVCGFLEAAPAESAASGPPAASEKDDVALAIQALPAEYRVPVAVYFAGRFPYEEIARIVERPVDWVRDRLHAGRRMLRRELVGSPASS